MCCVVEDEAGGSVYFDNSSESSGPPLEAVVTIPIHHGKGAGAKSGSKPSGYISYTLLIQNTLYSTHSNLRYNMYTVQ